MRAIPQFMKTRELFMLVLIGLTATYGARVARASEDTQDEKAREPEAANRVMYVPESVKADLKEQIKKELLEEMQKENWAAPHEVPGWLHKININCDLRFRYESVQFPKGNANSGEFPDFNAINTGQPFDVNFVDTTNERYLDVDKDRNRLRYRARLGFDMNLGSGFKAGLRFASGNDNNPVSSYQTLGTNFGKYPVWIDQVFISYAPLQDVSFGSVNVGLAFNLGRFENPFYKTTLTWANDLNMDGIAAKSRLALTKDFAMFFTAGGLILEATSINYPPEQTSKLKSRDKWLYAAQLGFDYKPIDRIKLKAAAGYYQYDGIQGRASDPCDTNLKGITCDTDSFKPAYAQKGNTYMALRTPSDAALAAEAAGLAPRYQYFGLASKFREITATVGLDLSISEWLSLKLESEYVRNVDFSKKQISAVALNNLKVCDSSGNCPFAGGNQGCLIGVTFASPSQEKRWDWNVGASYRYLESDAALDAFTDADIGLGGTNLKGYVLDAAVAVAEQIWLRARYFSSDNIAGPPMKIDILQVDLTARF